MKFTPAKATATPRREPALRTPHSHLRKTGVERDEAQSGAEPDGENCPVIHADKVFLGISAERNLRVVCFEGPSAAA